MSINLDELNNRIHNFKKQVDDIESGVMVFESNTMRVATLFFLSTIAATISETLLYLTDPQSRDSLSDEERTNVFAIGRVFHNSSQKLTTLSNALIQNK